MTGASGISGQASAVTAGIDLTFLHDGGQPVPAMLDRLFAFIAGSQSTLDIAIYDAHLDDG